MTVARGQPALPADVSLAAGSNRRPGAPSICVRRIGATGLKNREACGWRRRVKVDAFLDEVCYDTRKLIVRHVIRPTDMSILDEPKIDCHVHVIDPVNFPYRQDVAYKPAGQEIGSTAQFRHVMDCYNVKHALLVQPNSGYGSDNSCMLDAIETGEGRFKGVAIIDLDADIATLKRYKARGIIGAAINPTFHGNHHYRHASGLMRRLADLDMYFNLQVENEQFLMYAPWIEENPGQGPDRPPRTADPSGRPQPASLCGHSAPCGNRSRERQVVRLPEICPFVLSVRGLLAVCARAGRCLHARSLRLVVGLALSARAGTAGLWTTGPPGRPAFSGCRRPAQAFLGHAKP